MKLSVIMDTNNNPLHNKGLELLTNPGHYQHSGHHQDLLFSTSLYLTANLNLYFPPSIIIVVVLVFRKNFDMSIFENRTKMCKQNHT